MSFLSAETSTYGGKPIELYKFTRGSIAWLLNTSTRPVVFNGDTYLPDYVKRGNLLSTAQLGRQQLMVTIRADHDLAVSYIGGMPAQPTILTVFRQHVGESEVGTVWAGRVTSISFAEDEATVACDPISTALKRLGLRSTYQVLCRYALYGPQCRAVDNRTAGSVSSVVGNTVTVALDDTPADDLYTGGTIRSGEDAWLITKQTGLILTISSPPQGLQSGAAVTMSLGCDHTTGTNGCQKFANLDNYGGFPFMPDRNPFGNNPII